ncbi:hypothetical protein C4K23_3501 [Pseudomonas chlororaphis]|nr:hypothetical protein C4K23_3501 [Pseudomonas chlororaphis]
MYVESRHPPKTLLAPPPPSLGRTGAVGYRKKSRARSRFS